MDNPTKQPAADKRPLAQGRGLYDVVADVSQYALALARTYENRRPHALRRGRLHTV